MWSCLDFKARQIYPIRQQGAVAKLDDKQPNTNVYYAITEAKTKKFKQKMSKQPEKQL